MLIAEDHEVTRRGIRELLREAVGEAEVTEAEDVPSLTERLSQQTWDLILLDIIMPGGSILDSIRQIRASDASVPILVLTAATELEYVMQSMSAGANGLAHKHLPGDELIEAIRKVARGGTYLHSETAVEIAKSLRGDGPALLHERLSERELDVFRAVARGRAVKEIAGDLGISDKTVATYLGRIREKTGLINHVEITRYALQNGLVD
ncbi:response regulator transcription factor [Phenylobacterium sp.]|uniref:response regulator n=1 Tax=Phenylobacterium sp. TaxID=1871053 RepID=UPI0025EBFCA2|nr:response regulator transcription factor [Phenylobacterium sp.]